MIRRSKPLKRTALKRGPGPKAEREREALDLLRETVTLRAHGQCEAPWYVQLPDRVITVPHSYTARRHDGSDVHHCWPEDRDRGIHDPRRALLLCPVAHRWAHSFPADAKLSGILRPDQEYVR